MRKFLLVVAILMTSATGARAWLDAVVVEPFRPAVGDSVKVHVYGTMPNSCWKVIDTRCGGAGGATIDIEVETYDFGGRPLDHCLMVLQRYEVVCEYRLPVRGPYTVTAVETCDSLNPCTGGTLTATFDTRGPRKDGTAEERRTWSAIKSCYR